METEAKNPFPYGIRNCTTGEVVNRFEDPADAFDWLDAHYGKHWEKFEPFCVEALCDRPEPSYEIEDAAIAAGFTAR